MTWSWFAETAKGFANQAFDCLGELRICVDSTPQIFFIAAKCATACLMYILTFRTGFSTSYWIAEVTTTSFTGSSDIDVVFGFAQVDYWHLFSGLGRKLLLTREPPPAKFVFSKRSACAPSPRINRLPCYPLLRRGVVCFQREPSCLQHLSFGQVVTELAARGLSL